MRLIFLLILICILQVPSAWADLLIVSGYVQGPNGASLSTVEVKLVYGGKKTPYDSNAVTPSGPYLMTPDNVDHALKWFVTCETEQNGIRYVGASNRLVFTEIKVNGNSAWKALVDVKLYLATGGNPDGKEDSTEETVGAITANNTITGLKIMSGELTTEEGNIKARKETIEILNRAQLGILPGQRLNEIRKKVLLNFDNALPTKDLLKEDKFVTVQEVNRRNLTFPATGPASAANSVNPAATIKPASQYLRVEVVPNSKYNVCVTSDVPRAPDRKQCVEVTGNSWIELRDAAVTQLCGVDAACRKAAIENQDNVRIFHQRQRVYPDQ